MRWFMASLLLLALALPARSSSAVEPTGAGPVNLAEVLRTLAQEHEARERLQPALLLEGALAAASEAIPPLLYERSGTGDGTTLRVTVGANTHDFAPAAPGDLARLAVQLGALQAFLAQSLPPAERPPHLDSILAGGLLRVADEHSALLSAAAYEDFQSQASGRAGGLGMLLARGPEGLAVESVLPDSPAERAGLRGGDRLLQIGERTVPHLPVDEALGLIRGRVGTPVELLILRTAEPGPRQLTLRRSSLSFASVTSRLFEEGGRSRIGYVQVRSFQETTTAELSEHLQRMSPGRPGLAGIVLDLRDNPGGVLEQAIRVADLFLERGTIVTMRGARGQREVVPARWYHSISSAPLVVLVNEGTASAGEVVAGALKFNHRALLVGGQTFGKDSIQSVFPLSGGSALKLTVARFLPANGQAMDGRGIVPHLWLRPVRERPAPARFDGLRFTATGAAPEALQRVGNRDSHPVRELPYLVPALGPGAARASAEPERDYALAVARHLLLANAPQGQSVLLQQALEWAQAERRAQDLAIAQRLAAADVDWSHGGGDDGGQVELLRVAAQVRPAGGDAWAPLPEGAPIAPGAGLRLVLTVRNAGALPLHRVLCIAESDAGWLRRREVPIGRLAAGLSAEATLEVEVPAHVPQGLEPLRLRIYDGQRRLHYRATVLLALGGARLPRLQVTLHALDDGSAGSRGNGDGRAQPGEVLALRLGLRNVGDADAGPGRFWLSGGLPGQAHLVRPWQALAPVPAGGLREAVLLLALGRLPPGGPPVDGAQAGPQFGPRSGPGGVRLNLMNDSAALQELSWPLTLDRAQPLPRLRMAAPVLELQIPDGPVESARVVLRGAVRDDRGLHDLAVYRNGRKLLYQSMPDEASTELPLRLVLPLEPGRNLVRVEVRDRDGLVTSRTFTLWQGRGRGFPLSGPPVGGA